MDFKEWFQTRAPYFWVRMGEKLERADFRRTSDTIWEVNGEPHALPEGTDRHVAFAYLVAYPRWCRKHDQIPGDFEPIEEDELTVEDVNEIWAEPIV